MQAGLLDTLHDVMRDATFDPDSLAAGISAATARKAAAIAEYQAATAELDWLRQGARLFGLEVPREGSSESDELAVDPANGKRPTLRQAILTFLAEAPDTPMTIPELAAALKARALLPERADAQKAVSDMAASMAGEDQLERVGRGVYKLHPRLALALESRVAMEHRSAALRDAVLAILPHDRPLHTSAIRAVLVESGQLEEDHKAYLVLQAVLSAMFTAGEVARPGRDQYVRITDLDSFEASSRDES
jgi:hypothetical protein